MVTFPRIVVSTAWTYPVPVPDWVSPETWSQGPLGSIRGGRLKNYVDWCSVAIPSSVVSVTLTRSFTRSPVWYGPGRVNGGDSRGGLR